MERRDIAIQLSYLSGETQALNSRNYFDQEQIPYRYVLLSQMVFRGFLHDNFSILYSYSIEKLSRRLVVGVFICICEILLHLMCFEDDCLELKPRRGAFIGDGCQEPDRRRLNHDH